jgi:hypothetical protein
MLPAEHRKLLFFYYNPDDPHLFVRKRGFYWSMKPFKLNFARPAAWIVAALTLVLIIILMPFNHDMAGFLRAIRHLITNQP